MARHPFCGGASDWAMTEADGLIPTPTAGATVTAWDSITGGAQIVDLSINSDGSSPIDHVSSSDGTDGLMLGQVPMFYGPDNVWEVWIQADDGPRVRVPTVDVGASIAGVESDISDVAADLAAFVATKGANSGLASLDSSGLLAAAQRPTVSMTSLTDVNLTGLTDKDMLKWDTGTSRWVVVGTAVSWTTLSVSGTGISNATAKCRLIPVTQQVEFQFRADATSGSNNQNVCTLPVGMRPTNALSFPIATNNSTSNTGRVDILSTGVVNTQVTLASGSPPLIRVNCTFTPDN